MPYISVAGEIIPAASLPDCKIELRKGETTYRVTVSVDGAFSAAQRAACLPGATVIIKVEHLNYQGIVNGFGCRPGHSVLQIVDAISGLDYSYTSFTTAQGDNKDLKFSSLIGTGVAVVYDGHDLMFAVQDGLGGYVNTEGGTAKQVMDAANADPLCNQIFRVSLAPGSDGSGILQWFYGELNQFTWDDFEGEGV